MFSRASWWTETERIEVESSRSFRVRSDVTIGRELTNLEWRRLSTIKLSKLSKDLLVFYYVLQSFPDI